MDRFWKYKFDHILFWTATVSFHAFTRTALIREAGVVQFVIELLVRNTLLAVVIYLNLFLLIPRFAQQKKFARYVLYLALSLMWYAFAKNAHDVYLHGYLSNISGQQPFFQNTFYNLSIGFFYLAFSVALYLSKEWYLQRAVIRKIEIEKLNTELDYLKAQLNPHFLFNAINTIYFQIDKQNTNARETLMTFSEMLRYQLYECNGKEIPVEREIAYLRNYIDLQRLRKEERDNITFVSGAEVANFTISPLLLIPFVENAFKHVSHFQDKSNEIEVRLGLESDVFRMNVLNTRGAQPMVNNGIGLKNVRRRLELLYPERHRLEITETDERFTVDLRLWISDGYKS